MNVVLILKIYLEIHRVYAHRFIRFQNFEEKKLKNFLRIIFDLIFLLNKRGSILLVENFKLLIRDYCQF